MSEPKMVGCGHAFEYTRVDYDDEHDSCLIKHLDILGAEGWEVICFLNQMVYLKRKTPTAYELKLIAEADKAAEALKAVLSDLQGGSDGKQTH